MNHTHFIFADDGSIDEFEKEQELRGKFERTVHKNQNTSTANSANQSETMNGSASVPIVCVMVEGGSGTIDTVKNALINEIPCVVIDGSGRAADVLAYVVKHSAKIDQNKSEQMSTEEKERKKKELVEERVKEGLELKEQEKFKNCVEGIMKCLSARCLQKLRIFKIYEDGESVGSLDKAILRTLLELGNLEVSRQFQLAFIWDRADLAEKVVLQNPDFQKVSLNLPVSQAMNAYHARNHFCNHIKVLSLKVLSFSNNEQQVGGENNL